MTTAPAPAASPRLESIDLLRGLVMVWMLLDHTRDFLHVDGLTRDPTDPTTTTPLLFLTRWITHFCAPTFVLLAGVSARLQALRGKPRRELARHLVARGLLLVALELVVLRPLIWFDLDPSFLAHLQVIWVIGWSMVILAGLIAVPIPWLLALALATIGLHDLADGLPRAWPADEPLEIALALLHQRTGVQLGSGIVFVQYSLVPWFAVLALGYVIGGVYALEPARRKRILNAAGAVALVVFFAGRWINMYGDPRPWSVQATPWRTAASFFALEKYPPSLFYLAMTLGPALLALAWLDGRRVPSFARPLLDFGRVPLVFYVLQWPMVHAIAWLFQAIAGQPMGWDRINPLTLAALPEGCGFDLSTVYAGFALGLLLLWPICRWYAAFRRRHPDRAVLRYI
jgi:uncharacterized membrane protein